MSYTTMYGVTLTVEVAFSSATGSYGAWDVGLWDVATWGPDESWTDVTGYLHDPQGQPAITINRQFSREMQIWESGTASVKFLNLDGRFSPSNTSGPYTSGGVTGVRAWRPIRITATYAGVSYPLYRGYALDWQEEYDQAYPGGGGAYVTVPCTDEWGALAGFDGLAQAPVGAGETSGVRIHRILDAAGHAGGRAVDVGNVTMQATDMSADAIPALQLVTESEGGAIFVDADGTVVFEHNYSLIDSVRSNTVQATFGDGAGDLPVSAVVSGNDGDLLTTVAAWQRVGGTVQTAADNASRALNRGGKRSTRTDLICETDIQALSLAEYYVYRFAQPESRFKSITVKPRAQPATLFPQVLGRRVRDLIHVNRRPPGGYTVSRDCHITGITHAISKDDFVTTFGLWSAAPTQLVARWDVGSWDVSNWFI